MEVLEVEGLEARCSLHGVERQVSLFMLQHESLAPGDFLLVHVGYAIQKLDAEEARETLSLVDELAQADLEPEHDVQGSAP